MQALRHSDLQLTWVSGDIARGEVMCSTCGGETMRRQIPGLHLNQRGVEHEPEGLFLVRLDRVFADGGRELRTR